MKKLLSPLSISLASAIAACTLVATPAFAETTGPMLDLQAQIFREVPNDTLSVTLTSTHSQAEPQALTREVLADLNRVSAHVKALPHVQLALGSVQVSPQWKDGKIISWSASGQAILKSTDMGVLAAAVGKLGAIAPVSNAQYSLSEEGRKTVQAELLKAVSTAYKEKAATMAKDLGFSGYTIGHTQLAESGGLPPVYVPHVMMVKASPAGNGLPADGNGTTRVSVALSGTILLTP